MKPKFPLFVSWKLVMFWAFLFVLNLLFWNSFLSNALSSEWIPKDNWSLVYVSSEQIVTYDEKATNAFDSDPTTHWFSRWSSDPIPYPQEIHIDLGAEYLLDGFSYLTWQRTSKNGCVKDYKFYVSQDPSNWGAPVAEGSFPDRLDIKIVPFNKIIVGRYIRFVALSDYSGSTTYAHAAEIGVRSADILKFEDGNLKVTFDPSPDPRAIGHNFYWTNTESGYVEKIDLQNEIIYVIPKGTLAIDSIYQLTATAYGIVDEKLEESVHSDPLYIELNRDSGELILLPPTNFRLEIQ
jgi:hypothetical protein